MPSPAPPPPTDGKPRVGFSDKTNELLIYPGGRDGQTLSVTTPLGPAVLLYSSGKVTISYRGRDIIVDQPTETPARLVLTP